MGRLDMLFDASLYAYLLATVVLGVWFFWRRPRLWHAGSGLLATGLVCQTAFMIARGAVSGRPPFANTFETLVLLAACVVVFFLASAALYNTKPLSPLVALTALFVTLFAYLIMQDEIAPLMPALRNRFWLLVHVVFCLVSYAAFLLAYIFALAFLMKDDRHAPGATFVAALSLSGVVAGLVVLALVRASLLTVSRGAAFGLSAGGAILLAVALWPLVGWVSRRLGIRERLPEQSQLEETLRRAVSLGFPFLTLGIMTGSYWASQAWGRYWGWDDKEVAALVTWLVFAIYLQLWYTPKWRSPWNAWVAVLGFWCVLFTYFGVNFLLGGLHSYA